MNNIELKRYLDFYSPLQSDTKMCNRVAALLDKILHIYLTEEGNNKAIDKFDNLV